MAVRLGIVAVTEGYLTLRAQPAADAARLDRLRKGLAVQILEAQGEWLKVAAGNTEGFVAARYILEQSADPAAGGMRSLLELDRLAPQARRLVEQALGMIGRDEAVFGSLPEELQRECYGWQFRHDRKNFHHKDLVCADLVYICYKAAGLRTQWQVTEPAGTTHTGQHAANYFRPNALLRRLGPEEALSPGDLLVYWSGELASNRISHVNLYIGPFAGVDLDGRVHAPEARLDVVNASIDYLKNGKEVGTGVMPLSSADCLRSKFGKTHVARLRHADLESVAAPQASATRAVAPEAVPVRGPGLAASPPPASMPFTVAQGQLTFDAEGLETPGPYFSRRLHVPSASSGLTLGRGYDMKHRQPAAIRQDLIAAGIDTGTSSLLSEAAGLAGSTARQFIVDRGLAHLEITPEQQKALFDLTYQGYAREVKRICDKPDTVAAYGATDWGALHPAIRDTAVDLCYRGDYNPTTRKRVQGAIAGNDLIAFEAALRDADYWVKGRGVPQDRFTRRADFLRQALRTHG